MSIRFFLRGQGTEGREQEAREGRSSTNVIRERCLSTFRRLSKLAEPTPLTSTTPASQRLRAGSVVSLSARTRLGGRGSLRLAKAKARASGGPTRTSGETNLSR